MFARMIAALMLVFLARCELPPPVDCALRKVTEIPMEVQDNLLVVRVGINGHWVDLVVDTGAERTTISTAAADRLGLPHDPRFVTRSLGVGGASTNTDVTIQRLDMGGVHFWPITRIAVGTFNIQTDHQLKADGLLGADVLLAFEMDIDVHGHKLTLYHSRVCPDAHPAWNEPWVEIQGVRSIRDRLLVPIELDNVTGMAILDTGAMGNNLGVSMARRMGLSDQAMAGDPEQQAHGVGPGVAKTRLHRFNLLRIGPIAIESPAMTVFSSDVGIGDALIGEQFLLGRRIWLSFRNSAAVFVSKRSTEQ
jgi:predicted aspartyl protease